MDEIKHIASNGHKDSKVVNVDLEELVSKIKIEHPNLFLNLKDLQVVPR
jgi:hypothetical protein